MARIVFWNKELRRHLTMNYEYDGVLGVVYKTDVGDMRADKERKAIGSMSAAGDLITNVNFGGKVWATRLAKLAVFLKTGEQHQRIGLIDEDPRNIKWENLLIEDSPCNSEEEYREMKNTISAAEAKEKMDKKRIQALEDDKLKSDPSMVQLSAHKFRELSPIQLERKQRREAELARQQKLKDDAAAFLEDNPLGYVDYSDMHNDQAIITTETKELFDKCAKPYLHTFYIYGLFTDVLITVAERFWQDCNAYSGIDYGTDYGRCVADYCAGPSGGVFEHAGVSKWVSDRAWWARLQTGLAKDEISKTSVFYFLQHYTYNGAKVDGPYERVPPEVIAKFSAGQVAIQQRDVERRRVRAEEHRARKALTQAVREQSSSVREQPLVTGEEAVDTNYMNH